MKVEKNEEKLKEAIDKAVDKSAPVQPIPMEIKIIKTSKVGANTLSENQDTIFKMLRRNQMNQIVLDKKISALAPMIESTLQNQFALEKKMLWVMAALGAELPKEVESELDGVKKKSTIIGAEGPKIIK